MPEEEWLSFQEAVELVRSRTPMSFGRAEKIVHDARTSGEVQETFPIRPPLSLPRLNKDDLNDWLDRQQPRTSTSKAGRRPKFDPAKVKKEVFKLMDHHGWFDPSDPEWDTQARLEEELMKKFGVAELTAREWATKFSTEWKAEKADN